jgi:SAM-dependent methyltransferase
VTFNRDWEREAERWLAWARTPTHDAYWDYSPRFFELVPAPGGRTLDIGCGEGRVSRDLAARGHRVTAIDGSPTLLAAAREAQPHGEFLLADAADLPFPDASFELAVAYNVLMDVQDMPGAVREAARVLRPGGRFCLCVTHPLADAGKFETQEPDAPFVIRGSYFGPRRFDETFESNGLTMRFCGWCYSVEEYARAFEDAGLLIEALREPAQLVDVVAADPAEGRWQRVPMFLFARLLKPS